MAPMLYKHLLGWPITSEDIKAQDEEFYQSLQQLNTLEDVSIMCLDFTITEENMGRRVWVDLIEGGSELEVTNENLSEYLEAIIQYHMFKRTLPQLTEILLGFFDVVPEPALTVFDPKELELMLGPLPTIDLDAWKANTIYSGLFEESGESHQVVKWFWEVVCDEFDEEMRARLLRFTIGPSSVPGQWLVYLQGYICTVSKFCIYGVDSTLRKVPISHTSFNRIELPNYNSKKELTEKLTLAITTLYDGFGIE